jgi:hypothetical protein
MIQHAHEECGDEQSRLAASIHAPALSHINGLIIRIVVYVLIITL